MKMEMEMRGGWPCLVSAMLCCCLFVLVLADSSPSSPFDDGDDGVPAYPSNSLAFSSSDFLLVDGKRLQQKIDDLAAISDSPLPSVTRILYSDKDVAARRFVRRLMEEAGLDVRDDAIGNIFGRWEGSDSKAGIVATGSHIDAIPYSGKFDGVVGVLGAIEAIMAMKRAGLKPKKTIEVIMFTSEEPTRFGISCLGSRLLAGSKGMVEMLEKVVDSQNISFAEAAREGGYSQALDNLEELSLQSGVYSAFIELHIEQGPILELEGIPIGVVTAIAAPASLKVHFKGDGGHAGAVLMPFRNDAGLAAAELALLVEKHVLTLGSIDTVGTTGVLKLHPGAVNSIPSESHLEIDLRDIDEKRRNIILEEIKKSAFEVAKQRRVELAKFEIVNQDPPASSDKSVIEAMLNAAEELGLKHKTMISRAYHDSLFMARVAPMGMIFIPCYKGYSHRPDEFAAVEDIVNGIKVLALSLYKLSQ